MSKRRFYASLLFLAGPLISVPSVFSQIVVTVDQVRIVVPEAEILKWQERALGINSQTSPISASRLTNKTAPNQGVQPDRKRAGSKKATPNSKMQRGKAPARGNTQASGEDRQGKEQLDGKPMSKTQAENKSREQSQPSEGSKKVEQQLSKDDVRLLAKEFGLLETPSVNPHLAFNENDISQWYKRQLDETTLKLEFAARKAVLEAADKQGVAIRDDAMLSQAASQVLLVLLPVTQQSTPKKKQPHIDPPDVAALICEGDTSQELLKQAWEALEASKGGMGAKNLEKCLACTKVAIERWASKASEQQAQRLQSGECKRTPTVKEKDDYFASYWALSDIATAWFVRGLAFSQQENWAQAREAFSIVIEKYPCAFTWDSRGWFWRTAEGADEQSKKVPPK